jgi:hypothetical protein
MLIDERLSWLDEGRNDGKPYRHLILRVKPTPATNTS